MMVAKESTKRLVRLTYEVSTVLTVILLSLYAARRDFNIPLTYRTPFSDWSSVRAFFNTAVLYNFTQSGGVRSNYSIASPAWSTLADIAWCNSITSSPQCACLSAYYNTTFLKYVIQLDASNITIQQLHDLSAQGAVSACLGKRPTWRKDTCNSVCSVHLVTPVMLLCLFASLFLSRVSEYESRALAQVAYYLPLALAALMILCLLVWDMLAGVFACLAILMVLVEVSYIPPCMDSTLVYFSYQRFLLGTLASWAAVTHQARDLYLAPSYGTLGFFLGVFAYYQCLVRARQSPMARAVALYLWVGMVVIIACFVLLVQQNWFPRSPASSSTASVVALFAVCAQSVANYSDRVQVAVGLAVLCLCSLAVMVDLASG